MDGFETLEVLPEEKKLSGLQLKISYRQILSIALPLMLSNLFSHFIGFTDVAFMGRLGDESQLAACGIASLMYLVLAMIPYGFSVGIQVILARRAGENNQNSIGNVFDNNFLFMGLLSIVMFLFMKLLMPLLLKQFISNSEVYTDAMRYLHYRTYEIFFTVLAFTLASFYMSIGKTYIIIFTALLMLLTNAILNYNLVFGTWGFPRMEIAGSGLASLIATAFASIVNLCFLFFSKYKKQFNLFTFKQFDWQVVKKQINLSGPVVLQHILGSASWLVFFLFVEKMGESELAASNVVKEVFMLFGITTWGLSNATNSLVSNILGQGRHDELNTLLKKIIHISLVFSAITLVIIMCAPHTFMKIFTTDAHIIEIGIVPLRIASIALFMMSITNIYYRAITGTGATRFSLLIEFITIVAYLVYVIILLPVMHVSLSVAWTSEFVYWFVMGSLSFLYLKSGRWKKYSV